MTMQSERKKHETNIGSWLLKLAKLAENLRVKGPKDLASNLD